MDFEQLRDFTMLAEELHFGRTARRRFTSAQTLSRRMQDLEQQLGVRLFDRTSRRVCLTPAGSKLLVQASHIVATIDAFQAEAQQLASGLVGSIRVMYSAGTGEAVGAVVSSLRAERPEVDARL